MASIGFKGKLVATIKLVNPINIDELSVVEYFEYTRITTYRGKQKEKVIGFKTKGLQWKQSTSSVFKTELKDDQKMHVKIKGFK